MNKIAECADLGLPPAILMLPKKALPSVSKVSRISEADNRPQDVSFQQAEEEIESLQNTFAKFAKLKQSVGHSRTCQRSQPTPSGTMGMLNIGCRRDMINTLSCLCALACRPRSRSRIS